MAALTWACVPRASDAAMLPAYSMTSPAFPTVFAVQTFQHAAQASEVKSLCSAVAEVVTERPESAAHGAAALAALCSSPHAPPDISKFFWHVVLSVAPAGGCLAGVLIPFAQFAASVADASQVTQAMPLALLHVPASSAMCDDEDAAVVRALASAQATNAAHDGSSQQTRDSAAALQAVAAAAAVKPLAQRRPPGRPQAPGAAQQRLLQWLRATEGGDLAAIALPASEVAEVVRKAHLTEAHGKENGAGAVAAAVAALQALLRAQAVDEARMQGVRQVLASLQQL